MKICLIGNSGIRSNLKDGQTTKVRLYLKKIKDEDIPVLFIDLENYKKHLFSIFLHLKKAIETCDRIVLITSTNGSRFLLPLINFLNRRKKKTIVFPLIGISVLHNAISNLSDKEKVNFFMKEDFSKALFSRKIANHLKKIDYILPETDMLTNIFRDFYSLDNCFTLNNFRESNPTFVKYQRTSQIIRLVFLSRVANIKGIFDLIDVVKAKNKLACQITLDIYGPIELSKEEQNLFFSLLDNNVSYRGEITNEKVIETIQKYDLLIFPTKYFGEGTPGIISESLIAGRGILSSRFMQANFLLKDGWDSVLFEMNNKEDLERKLSLICENKYSLETINKNAFDSGRQYTYDYNRNSFLKFVCGVNGD